MQFVTSLKFGPKVLAAAVLSCALVAPVAFAKDAAPADGNKPAAATGTAGDKPKAAKALRGSVVKVDGDKLTLKTGGKNGAEVTVSTDTSTKVTIDGKDAKVADLKEGQRVTVTPAEGTAQTITVQAPKPKKDATK